MNSPETHEHDILCPMYEPHPDISTCRCGLIRLARDNERMHIKDAIKSKKVPWSPHSTITTQDGNVLAMTRMESDVFNAALDIAAGVVRGEGR